MTRGLTEWGTMATLFSVVDISHGKPIENWLAPCLRATFSGRVSSPNPNLCVHCVMCRDVEYTAMIRSDPDIYGYMSHRKRVLGQVGPFDETDVS